MPQDHHKIYKKLVNEYPWLWDAPAPPIDEEAYRKAMKMEGCCWFPYTAYYDLNVLDKLKPNLYSYSCILAGGGSLLFRTAWQFSAKTYATGVICKHPDNVDLFAIYLDFFTKDNQEFLKIYKELESYESKEQPKFGFTPIK